MVDEPLATLADYRLIERISDDVTGQLYLADAPGVIECLDAKTGQSLWKERLTGNLWGSMLLADGKLYISNLEGTTFVLATDPKFEVLARNEIKEPTYAAPVVSGGEMFLRTYENLYCIQSGK